jgi:hypothetical protein
MQRHRLIKQPQANITIVYKSHGSIVAVLLVVVLLVKLKVLVVT